MASGWDFFGILNPDHGFGIGIFYSRNLEDRDRKLKNPKKKIPSKKSRKFRNPGDRDRALKPRKNSECEIMKISKSRVLGSGFQNPKKIPRKFRKNPGNPKIPGIRDFFASRDFLFPGFGIVLSLGILITRVRDFSYFRDFFPQDFRKIPGIRDFLPSGYLIS